MSDKIIFSASGMSDYISWQTEDKRTLKKINQLINDIRRNGYTGIGSPEPLKGSQSGYWSREIDKKNRIVYRVNNDGDIEIVQCRGHYGDK
ncbi:MAG: Txe/YoeB family addiction module toxin [Chitinispirillales bacterium]|jgi:toxin YoeB|nr:Txe/YoeB family addiction module toxin [Chitinispirillales bacterium]